MVAGFVEFVNEVMVSLVVLLNLMALFGFAMIAGALTSVLPLLFLDSVKDEGKKTVLSYLYIVVSIILYVYGTYLYFEMNNIQGYEYGVFALYTFAFAFLYSVFLHHKIPNER